MDHGCSNPSLDHAFPILVILIAILFNHTHIYGIVDLYMKLLQQRKKKGSSLKDACIYGVQDSVKDK
jgi:hypothetical protein